MGWRCPHHGFFVTRGHELLIYNRASGERVHVVNHGRGDNRLATGIAGDRVGIVSMTTELKLWDLATGEKRRVITAGARTTYDGPAISPDERKFMVIVDEASTSRITTTWDLESGNEIGAWPRRANSESVRCIAYSRDQKYLFVIAEGIEVYDVASGKLSAEHHGVGRGDAVDEYAGVRLSPDHRSLSGVDRND
jgi:WD40 repeat protein